MLSAVHSTWRELLTSQYSLLFMCLWSKYMVRVGRKPLLDILEIHHTPLSRESRSDGFKQNQPWEACITLPGQKRSSQGSDTL